MCLTDGEIKKVLMEGRQMLEAIQKKMDEAFGKMETLDETIRRVSVTSVDYGRDKIGISGKNDDMFRILEQRDYEQKKQIAQIQEELNELILEEEKINKVLHCMRRLPADLYVLIDSLYMNNETWEYYAAKNEISMSSLGRKKREAFKKMREMYFEGK